ncbi:hypothetical protein AB0N81_21275 [Streptomyces sp. NPDC093510]|uniref:hypothetical protein n=1 Tax=Streptomyces sp. NPDC093510 TaxID=3155199 RepID=UPI00342744FF
MRAAESAGRRGPLVLLPRQTTRPGPDSSSRGRASAHWTVSPDDGIRVVDGYFRTGALVRRTPQGDPVVTGRVRDTARRGNS